MTPSRASAWNSVRLGVAIPVSEDSPHAPWQDSEGTDRKIVAPLSLVVSAFAPVRDARHYATPQLRQDGETAHLLIDLGHGKNRLGASCLAQTYNQVGQEAPDVEPEDLRRLFDAIQHLHAENLLIAYHDRSDGGLFSTVAEMAFAGRCGVDLDISSLGDDVLAALFSEEVGVVLQHRCADAQAIGNILESHHHATVAH